MYGLETKVKTDSTAVQIAQIEQLRSLLECHPDKKVQQYEREHNTLCRFLKARKWDATEAKEMYVACAEWRSGPQPAPAEPPFKPEEIQKVCAAPVSQLNIVLVYCLVHELIVHSQKSVG